MGGGGTLERTGLGLILAGSPARAFLAKDLTATGVFLDEEMKGNRFMNMKTHVLLLCLTGCWLTTAFAQQPTAPGMPPRVPAPARVPPNAIDPNTGLPVAGAVDPVTGLPVRPLTKFSLDFPGGTPKELVKLIEKRLGRPLNVIVPEEADSMHLPAIKMNNVDVSQLFGALKALRPMDVVIDNFVYKIQFAFDTQGTVSDDSIWAFVLTKELSRGMVRPPSKSCRFYSLAPYLERGLTVDDITTAIETGWKMLGDSAQPTINFHKDTKLLIAVGEPGKLEIIDDVLKALTPPPPSPGDRFAERLREIQSRRPVPPPAGEPPPAKPAEKPKVEQ